MIVGRGRVLRNLHRLTSIRCDLRRVSHGRQGLPLIARMEKFCLMTQIAGTRLPALSRRRWSIVVIDGWRRFLRRALQREHERLIGKSLIDGILRVNSIHVDLLPSTLWKRVLPRSKAHLTILLAKLAKIGRYFELLPYIGVILRLLIERCLRFHLFEAFRMQEIIFIIERLL